MPRSTNVPWGPFGDRFESMSTLWLTCRHNITFLNYQNTFTDQYLPSYHKTPPHPLPSHRHHHHRWHQQQIGAELANNIRLQNPPFRLLPPLTFIIGFRPPKDWLACNRSLYSSPAGCGGWVHPGMGQNPLLIPSRRRGGWGVDFWRNLVRGPATRKPQYIRLFLANEENKLCQLMLRSWGVRRQHLGWQNVKQLLILEGTAHKLVALAGKVSWLINT